MRDIDFVLKTYSLNCWMSFFLWIMSVLGRAIARMSGVTLKRNHKIIYKLVNKFVISCVVYFLEICVFMLYFLHFQSRHF
jgi:hypothetical protein